MSNIHEFFEGFVWAVPTVFSDALAACRFEQGDTLYNTPLAYDGQWCDALKHLTYSLQVKSPPRGIGEKRDSQSKSIFASNWNMTVEVSLTDHKKNKTIELKSTQGRLYSLLWKGDLGYINGTIADPLIPNQAKQLVGLLSQAGAYIRQDQGRNAINSLLFLMPFDKTQQLLTLKFQKVRAQLRKFNAQINFIQLTDVKLTSKKEFAPTISIVCFQIMNFSILEVTEALKKALYTPAKNKKNQMDRFRLSAHGHLEYITENIMTSGKNR